MKRFNLMSLALAFVAATLFAGAAASAKDKEALKISGKSGCATCEGVTADGHSILLTDKEGHLWVLKGDSEEYKAVHKARKEGKTISATIDGEPKKEKNADGKEYMVAKVSAIKIEA